MLAPYPKMKPSGVEWLGHVPSHWQVLRGKKLFKCVDLRSERGEETLLTVSANHGIIPRENVKVTMFKARSYAGYKLCWPNDLVINSLWAWGRGLGVSQHHGIVSTAYGVYRPNESVLPKFIHFLVRSEPFISELFVRSKGIWISRLLLTDDSFLDASAPVPPADEQEAIVQYLDDMDLQIRQFVQTKQKLIERLEEHRQALIARVVTRGLNPNAKFKESGVEWLGRVPAHWQILRGKLLFSHKKQLNDNGMEKNILSLTLRGVVNNDPENPEGLVPKDYATYQLFRKGDLVFKLIDLENYRTSRVGLVHEDGIMSPAYIRIVPRIGVNVEFFYWHYYNLYLRGVYNDLGDGVRSTLGQKDLLDMKLPIPPANEQAEIVAHLNKATADIAAAAAQARQEIALVNEYRERLIADVVTGKLDARTAGAA